MNDGVDNATQCPRFLEKAIDYVPRHVSHSVGGSILFLGYAMSQAGVTLFAVVLGIEAYFNGYSLTILQEMIKDHITHDNGQMGIDHNNYFLVIERSMGKHMGSFVLVIFIVDVFCCSTFYYKISQVLLERLLVSEEATLLEKTGSTILTLGFTTLFLIGTEYGQKYVLSSSENKKCLGHPVSISHIHAQKISNVVVARNENASTTEASSTEEREINMQAVEKVMSNFDRKRLVLLLLFVLLLFSTICVSYETYGFWTKTKNATNIPNRCPGLTQPTSWVNTDFHKIMISTSIVLYCLKTYAVLLPVCVNELQTYDTEDYARLTLYLNIAFFVIYFTFPTAVYFTFGNSTTPLFVEGYGKNTIGIVLTILALAISATAMLLRIIAIFKLVQVLVTDINTEDVFWLVVVVSVFISLLISMVITDVMYIVIFAGSVTSNLLMHVIPSAGYICFKLRTEGLCTDLARALVDFYLHTILLIACPFAIYWYDKADANGCRATMEWYSTQP